ncbi:FtsK/SpoIIIE domain-containing protein [Bowdeniella massiliensis]|uniref:FtsK/SpoIIIE domain-containing protein n=1 Tax=Bowdeniella massiliensis TaxID=2932264 RepID=UPI002029509A|nr:FtsK/SpoIIIE domain-containing protein [Bowdeniella massiliensis]
MSIAFSVLSGPDAGYAQLISPGTHTIGRAGDIALTDPQVSRMHATIRLDARGLRLKVAGGEYRKLAVGRRPCRLTMGASRVEFHAIAASRLERPLDSSVLTRIGVPALMCLVMIPLAWGGPAWRWAMVALPAAMAIAGLISLRARRTAKAAARTLPLAAHEVLLTVLLGERGAHAPRVPRCLRRIVTFEPGEAWNLQGESAAAHARWLAGWLAAMHSPDVLSVDSPWVRTHHPEAKARVRFVASESAHSPEADEVVITIGAPLPWAAPLPIRRGHRLPEASARFTMTLAAALAESAEGSGLPATIALADLLELSAPAIRARWERPGHPPGPAPVPVGVTAAGPRHLDLIADGPHALVAGMTGAGKSELLTSWLLALAATTSPRHLTFLLVDFKGGAAFGPLRRLPHTIGVLTDLDPAATTRALTSLTAQLKQRERIFHASGVRSLAEYDALAGPREPLARILVVIDEFQALATDEPDLLDQFVRLATQGRSLGIHLIAATQRPAGAVTPTMRANMPLRICLRVTSTADSADILGTPDAAALPAIPGRAIVASEDATTVQWAWAGELSDVTALVERITATWQALAGGAPAPQPWAPPLPRHLPLAPDSPSWGLIDEPENLRHAPYLPRPGHLLILGGAASGKSSAIRLALTQRLRDPAARICLIGGDDASAARPGLIGHIPLTDAHLSRLFLEAVTSEPGQLEVMIDDLHTWRAHLDDAFGIGSGNDMIERLLRSARSVIATADASVASTRWAGSMPQRLILPGLDPMSQTLCGLPHHSALAPHPGRARESYTEREIQLSFVPPLPRAASPDAGIHAFAPDAHSPVPALAASPRRFRPLPTSLTCHPKDGIGAIAPAAELFAPEAPSSVLVIAPAGAGRRTALHSLREHFMARGFDVQEIDPHDAASAPLPAPAPQAPARPALILAASDPARVSFAATGALAQLKATGAVLLLHPHRMNRIAGLAWPVPSWVYAHTPAMNAPGRGVWLDAAGAHVIQVAQPS